MGYRAGGVFVCFRAALRVSAVVVAVAFLSLSLYAQNISTVAGGGPNNLAATSSSIGNPWMVVQDPASGSLYIADALSSRILKVDGTTQVLTIVAGNGINGASGEKGPAIAASLSAPQGIALDGMNPPNLYIADTGNNVVRVVNMQKTTLTLFGGLDIAPGTIEIVAGNGQRCTSPTTDCGDSSPAGALGAQLTSPAGVFLDGSGNIFVVDSGDNKIRKVLAADGTISTVAGTGNPCGNPTDVCGDGAAATSAELTLNLVASPQFTAFGGGVFVDGSNNIFIADSGDNRIREVTAADGKINTVAGNGTACATSTSACGDGAAATNANLNLNNVQLAQQQTPPVSTSGIFMDSLHNIFVADTFDNRIREFTVGGNISTVAGSGTACTSAAVPFCGDGGSAVAAIADLNSPSGVFVDAGGDIFIADQQDSAIRKVSGGNISTVAGIGLDLAYSGDTFAAIDAELQNPGALFLDNTGDIFIADTTNNVIRKVDAVSNKISTVAGSGVSCTAAPCGDGGAATAAQFHDPKGLALDAAGNIYIPDTRHNTIRVVNTQKSAITFYKGLANAVTIQPGKIEAVAGSYFLCNSAATCLDGGPAPLAGFNTPWSIALDNLGDIFIADTVNSVIKVVNTQSSSITVAGVKISAGDIQTIAGNYTACDTTKTPTCNDGGLATKGELNFPQTVYLDGSGNIYIVDNGDNVIRKVDNATGNISTVAGSYAVCTTPGSCGDKGAATKAKLNNPSGVFVDYAGDIYVSDANDSAIRVVNTQSTSMTISGVTIAAGNIDTVVGNSTFGFSGDGGAATKAQLAGPLNLGGDAAGDLFFPESSSGRVRKVAGISPIAPTEAPNSLTFSSQALGTTSSGKTVTITNNSKTATLPISSIALSGADAADFAEKDTCLPSVAGGKTCTITVTFTPAAAGSPSATLTITYGAAGNSQTVDLSGTAVQQFGLAAGTLSQSSFAAGGSATATMTITSGNGFGSKVDLTCAVSPSTSAQAPTCTMNPTSVTPTTAGVASTLMINTVAATGALVPPAIGHGSGIFYAAWMLLPAMLLSTAGMTAPKRTKLTSYVLLVLALSGVLFLVACGGGSSGGGGGGGGGTPATPSGQYSVKVTATSGNVMQTQTLNFTVQ